MQRNVVLRWVVLPVLLLAVGCAEQPQREPEPAGLVCDRFEMRWELDGGDLLLAVDTDLPDEGKLGVWVGRSYYKVGSDTEYSRDYYVSVFEPVSRWREPRRIPLDPDAWRKDLATFQRQLLEVPSAAFEVASIANDVEIQAVLHVNLQDDPRFGWWGNPNLSGAATSRDGTSVIVAAEASFEFPLE